MHLIGVPTIFLACLATTVLCDDMQIKWCSDTDGKGVCSEGIANFDACYQIPDSRAEDEAIRQGRFGGSFTFTKGKGWCDLYSDEHCKAVQGDVGGRGKWGSFSPDGFFQEINAASHHQFYTFKCVENKPST